MSTALHRDYTRVVQQQSKGRKVLVWLATKPSPAKRLLETPAKPAGLSNKRPSSRALGKPVEYINPDPGFLDLTRWTPCVFLGMLSFAELRHNVLQAKTSGECPFFWRDYANCETQQNFVELYSKTAISGMHENRPELHTRTSDMLRRRAPGK